jgi:hypothetical protein
VLGPLGHGWPLDPAARNLLLLGEAPYLSALIALARQALLHQLEVTLINLARPGRESYPAALLPPDIEYQIFSSGPGELGEQLQAYLQWADVAFCSLTSASLLVLQSTYPCVNGACLACEIETLHGTKRLCREGPILALRELPETGRRDSVNY